MTHGVHRFRVLFVVSALAAASVQVSGAATPAHAAVTATRATPTWGVDLGGVGGAAPISPTPPGGAVVVTGSASALATEPSLLQAFGSSGAAGWSVPLQRDTNGTPEYGATRPLIDAAGDAYWMQGSVDGPRLVGWHGSAQKWSVLIPVETPSSGFSDPILGADGRVYVYLGHFDVAAFSPTDGSVTDIHLNGNLLGNNAGLELATYRSGLVVLSPSYIAWTSFGGRVRSVLPTPTASDGTGLSCSDPVQNCVAFDGSVFLGANSAGPLGGAGKVGITDVTPTGVAWLYDSNGCGWPSPYAMPDGGVAVKWAWVNGECNDNITVFNSDGTTRWSVTSGTTDPGGYDISDDLPLTIDGSGAIIEQTNNWYAGGPQQCFDSSDDPDDFVIATVLDPASGATKETAWAGVNPDGCPIYDGGAYLTSGPDHIFLSADTAGGAGPLWAINVAGLRGPYETTALWVGKPGPPRYAALGDSFASGEGSFSYLAGTATKSDECHRATNGYAEQLAANSDDALAFAACSGATIADITNVNHEWPKEPPQIRATPGASLATLSIGINDLKFLQIMKDCVYDAQGLYGSPGCAERDEPLLEQGLNSLTSSLPVAYGEVADELAPTGSLLVVGYPHLFGYFSHAQCRVGTHGGVLDYVYVSQADATWLNDAADRLNNVIRTAVAQAQATTGRSISYVDGTAPFAYHGLCDIDPQYFNGVKFGPNPLQIKPEDFHPNIAGQNALAGFIEGSL